MKMSIQKRFVNIRREEGIFTPNFLLHKFHVCNNCNHSGDMIYCY